MGDEKDAFYVVRKGDVIGIYKTFADCQAQAAFSPLHPSISVYKGYCLSEQVESYLISHGLKQAAYSISASDVQDGMFGALSVCPFQDPGGSSCSLGRITPIQPVNFKDYAEIQASISAGCVTSSSTAERIQKHVGTGLNSFSPSPEQKLVELKNFMESRHQVHPVSVSDQSSSVPAHPQKSPVELKNYVKPQALVRQACQSCTIEFDGASKGNPGQAGAGAVLRAVDGSAVWLLREGVGIATNNVAEYRALILGLRTALQKGYKHVHVRGDSQLVCYQVQGKWKVKHENMAKLCKEAKELTSQFTSFVIDHVLREFNSDADAQANRAINLRDGQVQAEFKAN